MTDNVYAISELAGTSSESIEDAIKNAIDTASQSLKNLDWFEVTQIRGHIESKQVAYFQVVLKLGFRYEQS